MNTITPVPLITYHWHARVHGLGFVGLLDLPDCAGALEQGHRALLKHLANVLKTNPRPSDVVVVWRVA